MTRTFDAPRSMVFDAWTKPDLLKRWLGVRNGWSMATCEVDLKVGGRFRYTWRKGDAGPEFGISGVYREIVRPDRLVNTEAFEGQTGEALDTTIFVEEGGKTTVTTTIFCESQAIRDEWLKSGMTRGVGESYDTLAEVLATIA